MYDVLDWGNDPGAAGVTLTLGVLVCPVVHSFLWVVSLARDWIHRKLFLTATLTIPDDGLRNTAFTA